MPPPAQLPTRKLGKDGPEVPALGFGLMGLSGTYGPTPPDEERFQLLDRAWELGYTNWDTADMYGDSEDLLGKWFKLHPERRADIFLATKFALRPGIVDGKRTLSVDTSAEACRERCETSLKRLGVECIDLYYIHRVDGETPIEVTMQELVKLRSEGKIKHIGISACSSTTLRRASAVAPVAALQVEYSPWSLEIEGAASTHLLATCRDLGVAVLAYSPVGRGFLTGEIRSPDDFAPTDLRRLVPRFSAENFPKNLVLVDRMKDLAARKGCTPGQLAIAWLMAQGEEVIPLPGTRKVKYLEENVGALKVKVTEEEEAEIRGLINDIGVAGEKMSEGVITDYGDTPEMT